MRSLLLLICVCFCGLANAQKTLSTGNAVIKFVSTRNSDVQAVNSKVNVTINDAGDIHFNLLIKDFKFSMETMEEHFNKEYMESDKYPNAFFKGKINKGYLTKPGVYKVNAAGELSIHNITKKVVVNGTLQVEKTAVSIKAKFVIDIDDYKVDTGLGGVIIGSKMEVDVAAKCQ